MAKAKAQPASPIAVRCVRLRAAPGADASRVFIAASCLAPTIWLFAFMSIAAARMPATPGNSAIAQLITFAQSQSGRLLSPEMLGVLGFFALTIWVAPAIVRQSIEVRLRSWTPAARARDRMIRRPSKPIFIAVFTLILLAPIAIMLFGDGPVPGALLGSFIYLKVSLLLGIFALFDRRGTHLACAKCGYAMSSWRSAKPTCPECANPWKEPWNARVGIRVLYRGLAALSIALLIAGGIMLVVAQFVAFRT
jgi:uncharacterized protein with PQ loop repeat